MGALDNMTIAGWENRRKFDLVGFIIAYESGELESESALIEGFQHLIDSGQAWSLQGSYGRMARLLIEQGACHE